MTDRISQLQTFVAADPSDAQAHFLLGYELNKAKRWEEAAGSLRRCVELDPMQAAAFKQLGDALKRLERIPEAADAYRRGMEAGRGIGNEHTARECETMLKRITPAG